MSDAKARTPSGSRAIIARAEELFREQQQNIVVHTDRLMAWLMAGQWLAAVGLAAWLSPLAWSGLESRIHPHVWFALFLGAILTSGPVLLAWREPGKASTRQVIAVGQMLMSSLLIHLTGGRIETHFHVFGSLAILAFYRDWRVMISASLVVYVDHLLRGIFWPESVYGVATAPMWRSAEHGGWVLFEVVFLLIAMRKSISEMRLVAERQARVELVNEEIERTVEERTADLTREVAERRLAEESLRKSREQLAQAQQLARVGSWEWDLAGNKMTCSAETHRLYGRKPEEPVLTAEAGIEQCVHPEDRERVRRTMAEAIQSRKPFVCEHRVVWRDGQELVLEGRGEVLLNERGQPVKLLGIVQDITETRRSQEALRQREEQLRQAQKMEAVGRLASGVAHDFNNLLTVINGYCGLTLQQGENPGPTRHHLEEIQKASNRAAALTNQLLAFSRKQVLRPRVMQVNEVVRGMEKMLRRLIGEDIELAITYEAQLRQVEADPGQLEQVVMNLVVNARDAMPRGGALTIKTSNVVMDQKSVSRNRSLEPGKYVMLAISDTGIGMNEAVQAHLFEPFFTTKGQGKGTGLGLATCYGIICQSGGDIRVYSEPNKGTTFKIYLPCTEAALVPSAKAELKPLPKGTEAVLVVEDDPAVRILAVTVLNRCGYQVQEAGSAFEAMALLKRNPQFNLVITDVIMPQMSGKELQEKISQQLGHVKVLLMSGYTDDALAHHGVLDVKLKFLEKPFSPVQLAQKVREVLDGEGEGEAAAKEPEGVLV